MSGADAAALAFPGGTGVTRLRVYDWPCPDGLRGGSAHVHLASTEGYVITGGRGRLQTLGRDGFSETPLSEGDCLWFTPGTVHRLVNDDGELSILVVMANSGLPEAGDGVLTFPPEVLSDPARYTAAASLGPPGQPPHELEAAARRRRDLAIEGFVRLREQVEQRGPAALEPFLGAAATLVRDRIPDWRERWQRQAAAVAALTGRHLDGLAAGQPGHLRDGTLRVSQPQRRYGMCGWLTAYPT